MKIEDLKDDLLIQWRNMIKEKYCGETVLNDYLHMECDIVLSILDEDQRRYWSYIFSKSSSFKDNNDSMQRIYIQPEKSIFINESEPMIEEKLWTSTYENPCWVEARVSDDDKWEKVLFIANIKEGKFRYVCAKSLENLCTLQFNVYRFSQIRLYEEKINIELTREEAKQVMEFLKTVKK